ncbi:nucleotide sugar dehydrogenase [Chitinophaga ginsengisegetis]|uniref:nucleotide sugar dehydrogenase n=1 Tax=Chitinophaga ginsengisegetis TaxID=393003 RepID=UPI000DBA7A5E|nr:nucleotide sugar dehydrogenase [Chitinophaga ginsengisegetis]MDR6566546.1 UDP-N-acetyl-D-galactosamine dehydrogenase [Chitinophaga ginsengisegetis]MDR6646276.1 UDP-N-acetyl-D-galactosamine dehydrogenase [Chitinophaga ginsengisegetis]MDR6651131.1 UDP-N-acetyl-D-galactosamine dehydrogenase [Chitinophaga ginsengisegetis]
MNESRKIAVIGLGYVGLPLAIEFGKKYDVLGFDINKTRISELSKGEDHTKEADLAQLRSVIANGKGDIGLKFSFSPEDLHAYNVFIVTVPTPIDQYKAPDLRPLLAASKTLGEVLKRGDIVIYESTVYPGCTEEDCVPVLEKYSGLKFNQDFYCGYSPERINPGDKINTLSRIRKVTSGSTPEIADIVDELYKSIITAGTHKATSIKVAEASKAIENAQRDINISFVNELALIFDRIGIDTTDVIEAAGTKWNFLKYKPGLVGGHCIGVDPYYLAHKAEALGYYPQVILSGRRVNDNMGMFVANKVVKLMIRKGHKIHGAKALILGVTFKENCPDIRNSRVIDIYKELCQFGLQTDVYDTHANAQEVENEYGIQLIDNITGKYDAVILAVAHDEFIKFDYTTLKNSNNTILFDTKSVLDRSIVDARL